MIPELVDRRAREVVVAKHIALLVHPTPTTLPLASGPDGRVDTLSPRVLNFSGGEVEGSKSEPDGLRRKYPQMQQLRQSAICDKISRVATPQTELLVLLNLRESSCFVFYHAKARNPFAPRLKVLDSPWDRH